MRGSPPSELGVGRQGLRRMGAGGSVAGQVGAVAPDVGGLGA